MAYRALRMGILAVRFRPGPQVRSTQFYARRVWGRGERRSGRIQRKTQKTI